MSEAAGPSPGLRLSSTSGVRSRLGGGGSVLPAGHAHGLPPRDGPRRWFEPKVFLAAAGCCSCPSSRLGPWADPAIVARILSNTVPTCPRWETAGPRTETIALDRRDKGQRGWQRILGLHGWRSCRSGDEKKQADGMGGADCHVEPKRVMMATTVTEADKYLH